MVGFGELGRAPEIPGPRTSTTDTEPPGMFGRRSKALSKYFMSMLTTPR